MSDTGSLLVALSDTAPCGEDLEYDPDFLALELAGVGKPEQQYGDRVIPAKPADWPVVLELSGSLAKRTRDLRVAVWMLRASARLRGWTGAVEGLQLLQGLLAQHWVQVHPRLDAPDGDNPQLRLSALSPLTPQGNPYPGPPPVLSDLRESRLVEHDRSSPLIREIELGMRAAEPLPGELLPTEVGIVNAVRQRLVQDATLATRMLAGLEAVDGIAAVLVARLPAADAPDLAPLRRLLAAVARAAQLAQGSTAPATGTETDSGQPLPAGVAAPTVAGTIRSREDVGRTIDQLCDWLERNEPSHPAPLLLRRAQRLLNKSFLEIVRDMAPDGADQVARLAGRPDNE